jgi:uncharacterized phiE125 gp8 family phage protein
LSHRLITPAAAVLATTAELKAQVRLTHDSEDTLLDRLIAAATRHVENRLRRALITQTWRLTLDEWPCQMNGETVIYVPRPPLIAVSGITYLDGEGDEQTLATSEYVVDTESHPGRITPAYGESWPTIYDQINAIKVTHTAGYGAAASSVPEDIRHAVLLLAGHWYENREAYLVGTIGKELELAFESLCDPYTVDVY